jgi:hypothetical protein
MRERGTARLEEGVAAYRAALTEWTRERVPVDWATARSNLLRAQSVLLGRRLRVAAASALRMLIWGSDTKQ